VGRKRKGTREEQEEEVVAERGSNPIAVGVGAAEVDRKDWQSLEERRDSQSEEAASAEARRERTEMAEREEEEPSALDSARPARPILRLDRVPIVRRLLETARTRREAKVAEPAVAVERAEEEMAKKRRCSSSTAAAGKRFAAAAAVGGTLRKGRKLRLSLVEWKEGKARRRTKEEEREEGDQEREGDCSGRLSELTVLPLSNKVAEDRHWKARKVALVRNREREEPSGQPVGRSSPEAADLAGS
jgi:hypothetical protein